jgi:hypothetical protein
MSLFQESIIRKHLSYLDQEVVDQAYTRYKEVYSTKKITNIKVAKEEQYQEGFIKDIFGVVLGYSVFPEQPFNIQTEKKNQADSKKADGAIFQGENVVGVIELKDNKTKNLDAVKDQAFGYKNNHKDCSYVISSNFHKLRFYVDDATEYEEFDLYNLDRETFKRFYLYLRKEGLLDKNIPKLLRQETKFHEENITKSLYKDYSFFKNSFFQNVVKNNPQHDKLLLFKKSQKFLDKVLFVLFAEDKGLVTTNSIVQIVEKWQDLKNDAFDTAKPLYQLVSLFFNNLFVGKKDQNGSILIPEFGGEIFAPDEVLDTLFVDDGVLKDDLLKLSRYDFNTDVDVNILGHIFEHSLSEIEEVEAELKGKVADKTKGKRKKDGVFYTPKFITKYIVENTVGKLCAEKKTELNLDVDIAIFEYQKADGKLNAKGIDLYETLNKYKTWLLTLKILDPACGSGAFLNQAVNFLVLEHQFVDDIIAELTNSPLRLFDIDIAILENNIYGVDINEESIEIAKLSLWLRTAKQGRKLSNLSNNIKCGNSLIDDSAVAGNKAFNWYKEFPDVFANGGFDVVIGNPPYVRQELIKDFSKYLSETYHSFSGKADLFIFFYEKAIELTKDNGIISFISSGKFIEANYGKPLLEFLVSNSKILNIIDFKDLEIFEGISAYPLIFTCQKLKAVPNYLFNYQDATRISYENLCEIIQNIHFEKININDFIKNEYKFIDSTISKLIDKIETNSIKLEDLKLLPLVGVKTGYNDGYLHNKTALSKNYIFGRDIKKYAPVLSKSQIIFPYEFIDNKYSLIDESNSALNVLFSDKVKLENRAIIKEGLLNGNKKWYEYQQINRTLNFDLEYIVYPNVSLGNNFTLSKGNIIDMTGFIIPSSSKFLLSILNSNLIKYLMEKYAISRRGGYLEYKSQYMAKLPIKLISAEQQQPFIALADLMLTLNNEFHETQQKFRRSLERKFALTELPNKLQDWYLLLYTDFIKELEKKKIKLTLSEEAEWETYFITQAKKALDLKAQIEKTDKEIDQMVYALYQLTEDEIMIVESEVN